VYLTNPPSKLVDDLRVSTRHWKGDKMRYINVRYVDSSSRLERLKWAVKRSDKLNRAILVLLFIAFIVSAVDWSSAYTFLNAIFHGL
jgi:hypothetical protein